MQTIEGRDRSKIATVKVMGPPNLVKLLVDHIKSQFYAVETSDYLPNDRGSGVHIFVKVLEARQ